MTYDARLHARPGRISDRTREQAPTGRHRLDLASDRDSFFYVPPGYDSARPAPLALLLHGAGGHAHRGLDRFQDLADEHGVILLALTSEAHTWDVVAQHAYGSDVELADRALAHVFAHYAIDPAHLAIVGFSDGASYALSVGLANGDLFTHVIAFSPGFVDPLPARGQPKVFVSHGTHDDVLSIEECSRKIVPELQQVAYSVTYKEFDGGHLIPDEVARFAIEWFLGKL
jgi:predicted esterase